MTNETALPTGDWNATSYDKVADPQTRWGAEVLDRLPLEGDDTVLDAGCGTGRVTELLLGRLPRGRVVALDASAAMLTQARERLARFGDRVTYVQASLEIPLPLEPASVDAVLSTATFHWVMDHDTMFASLGAALRPGGWLVAQCGGFGNIAKFLAVARSVDPTFTKAHNFQTPEATIERLRATGFDHIEAWLSDAPTRFERGGPLEAFLQTVCLRPNVDQLPLEEREPFVKAVAARMPEPVLDYVRLNITARKAA
ncbi:MAG TPA: methyltransferase domain-containing protein [Candidatus Limnocylindrales bacterium]|nr:methyltransferase domain-containing protein [Candidatus Limnocylindrales bacterium]